MSHRKPPAFLATSILSLALSAVALAGPPFTKATVTRTENKVSYGTVQGDQSNTRPAVPEDVVKAMNFLLSETESRAELKYDDGTIVRIGQNTIFTFEANSRTLTLKKGTFVFYIPKGQGGCTIKTPSLTAAITGCVGKVGVNSIALPIGTGVLKPSGDILPEGWFVRRNPDWTLTKGKLDPLRIWDGKLMTFNGPLPGLEELLLATPLLDFQELNSIESRDRVIGSPSGIRHFFPAATPTPATPTPTPITPFPITPVPITPVPPDPFRQL